MTSTFILGTWIVLIGIAITNIIISERNLTDEQKAKGKKFRERLDNQ